MANILGLLDAESFSTNRFKNYRRAVLYWYPNGAAPLAGLTSLLKEEDSDDPEYRWFEERMQDQRTTMAYHSTTVSLAGVTVTANATTGLAIGGTWASVTAWSGNTALSVPTTAVNNRYVLKVAAADQFRPGHVIKFTVRLASGTDEEVVAIVEWVDSTNNYLGFRVQTAVASVDYDYATTGREVLVIGSAFHEGSLNVSNGIYQTPIEQYNYTQIFRTPFELTGTARKTSVKYDESGPAQDLAKQHMLRHYIEIEKALHFGERSLLSGVGNRPVRTFGGIVYFLKRYEKQYSIYRGGDDSSTGPAAVTADTDDDKRIIENTAGTMSIKRYEDLLERCFRVTSNTANEKLAFCGNKYLLNMNRMYVGQVALNVNVPVTDTYGMDIVSHRTSFGTIHYKTHPLYNQNPILRYCALILDVNNIMYRYMQGRDTTILPNREPNDADYRIDEWLTECGMEFHFPESCMFIKNVQDVE